MRAGRSRVESVLRTAVPVLVFAVAATEAVAQARPPAPPAVAADAAREILRVRRFSGASSRNKVRTPEYRTSVTRGVKPAQEWFELSVTYDTAPEWIDELTFQYHVLTLRTERDRRVYSLFKTTVRYADIEGGRNHLSAVYLHPRALQRHGDVAATAVEILYEGKTIAVESDAAVSMPDQWWRSPAVTESKDVTTRDGYLLDRSQTPWALISVDDYEFIK